MSTQLGIQHNEPRYLGVLRLKPVEKPRPGAFICTPEEIEAHRQYLESMLAAIDRAMAKKSGAEESV